jgi:hypothetical protein
MRRATVVARTGERFTGFAPYVPSIADDGRVAFQAALARGGTAALVVRPGGIEPVLGRPDVAAIVSHPDVDRDGRLSAYVVDPDGRGAVALVDGSGLHIVARTEGDLVAIGPAGPTMDDRGRVSFRATLASGASGLFLGERAGVVEVARTGRRWSAFQGLPVVTAGGCVTFRADCVDGGHAILRWCDGSVETVVETGGGLTALGRFPSASDAGHVAFAATSDDGTDAVLCVDPDGRPTTILSSEDGFASCRGALVAGDGSVVALATPHGGGLGLFAGADPETDRLVMVGDPVDGSTVVDLAANPVSIDASGAVVARLALADRRELIVRFDP